MLDDFVIDDMEDKSLWAALSNDTTTLADSTNRLYGATCLSFAKVDGTDGSTHGGIGRTFASPIVLPERFGPQSKVTWLCYISSLSDVASAFLRLGTDASNYLSWTVADSALQAGWNLCSGVIGNATVTGNGGALNAIGYVAVGVTFDAESDALAGILVDRLAVEPVVRTVA